MSRKRILITGGTGFIGSMIARVFHAAGYHLRLFVRTGSRTEHLDSLNADLYEGDLLEPRSLAPSMADVDAVIHAAGDKSMAPRDHRRVWRTNVDGTLNVLNAALDAGVRRVVYTSSVAAIGSAESPTRILDETSHWRAGEHVSCYVRSKYRAEREAMTIAGRGLDLVVLNPSVVAGPGDPRPRASGMLLNIVQGRFPGYIDGGIGLVDVREVALAHLLALEIGEPHTRTIISAENRTLAELVSELCPLAGVSTPPRIPFPIARGLASLNERILARVNPKFARSFNREITDDAHRYWFVNNSRSRRLFGMRYRRLRETLVDTLRWAVHQGVLEPSTPQLKALSMDEPIDLDQEAARLVALASRADADVALRGAS